MIGDAARFANYKPSVSITFKCSTGFNQADIDKAKTMVLTVMRGFKADIAGTIGPVLPSNRVMFPSELLPPKEEILRDQLNTLRKQEQLRADAGSMGGIGGNVADSAAQGVGIPAHAPSTPTPQPQQAPQQVTITAEDSDGEGDNQEYDDLDALTQLDIDLIG